MAIVVRMPEVATGTGEAAIQSWLVDVGGDVAAGQPIAEIETEKAVVEYEAEDAGVLAGILVPAGKAATVGTPIAVLAAVGQSVDEAMREATAETGGSVQNGAPAEPAVSDAAADVAPEPAAAAASVPVPVPSTAPAPESASQPAPAPAPAAADGDETPRRLFASPLVRRLARERGLDLSRVTGTGPNGRIVRRDLDTVPPTPDETAAPAASGAPTRSETGYTDVPHTGMRRAIARRLTESTSTVPHYYLVADCRVDDLLALRSRINEQVGLKVSVNDLIVKAVATALRDVPDANAIWTDEATRRFDGVDVAVAVAVPDGLLTPVVHRVDRLSLSELSSTIRELAGRARDGRLKQHELEGGSFSVSNLGMYGTKEFSAIINPPHAGILAVGAASRRPVVGDDGELAVASVMTVTLSADHRVLDGALGAEWLAAFVQRIENPLSLLV